jgi:hypothetical protein
MDSELKHKRDANELRKHYADALRYIAPLDEAEASDITLTNKWLATPEHVHKYRNNEEHLGVLAFLVSPDRCRVFLINHNKAMMWLPLVDMWTKEPT